MIQQKLSLLARLRRHLAKRRVIRLQERQCEIRQEIVQARRELIHLARMQAFAERQAGAVK